MGHVRLGALPASRKWHAVVAMLSLGETGAGAIATASAEASEATLVTATKDRSVGYAFWLLTQLPLAAASGQFQERLSSLGLTVSSELPDLFEIGNAMAVALEANSWADVPRTDLGAIARQSAVESVLSLVGDRVPTLFEPTGTDVQVALAEFGRSDRFSVLAREFFSRLCRRSLEYFLSRELSNHVGSGQAFESIADHTAFGVALDLHCRQASRIIEDFAQDWYGKRLRDRTSVSRVDAAAFATVAFRKMQAELKRRRDFNV